MLDRPADRRPPRRDAKRAGPTSDRERRRLSRARRRQGRKLLRQGEVDEHGLIETLQNANRLSLKAACIGIRSSARSGNCSPTGSRDGAVVSRVTFRHRRGCATVARWCAQSLQLFLKTSATAASSARASSARSPAGPARPPVLLSPPSSSCFPPSAPSARHPICLR
jgi:hypothetical protein